MQFEGYKTTYLSWDILQFDHVLDAHQKVLFTENLPSDIVERLPSEPSTCRQTEKSNCIISLEQYTARSSPRTLKDTLLKKELLNDNKLIKADKKR